MQYIKQLFFSSNGNEDGAVRSNTAKKSTNPDEKYSVVDSYTQQLPEGKFFGFENLTASVCYANSTI